MQTNRLYQLVKVSLVALMSYSLIACSKEESEKEGAPRSYPVEEVVFTEATLINSYPAHLKGKLDVEIRPQISGQIVHLAVDEGDVVRKGQTLFRLDPVQYQEAVNAAKATIEVAKANVATSQLTAENNRELAQEDIIGAYALQTSENALLSAKAALAQAEAQLSSAQKMLSFTNITSPTDGVVGSIPFRLGSLVSPQMPTPMTTVSNNSEMYAHFSLTERELLELTKSGISRSDMLEHLGEVQFRLMDGTLYPHKGKVETVSGLLDAQTGSVNVRVLLPNPDRKLLSGSSGEVLIPNRIEGVFTLPQLAVYQIQEKYFVYVVDEEQVVHSREVQVYTQNDGVHYIITEGLNEGDKVVTSGVISLREGMVIEPEMISR